MRISSELSEMLRITKHFNPKPFLPRPHQSKAIKSAKKYFKNESRGKLIFPCGSGKSLTGYWITEALKSKRTLVAVPSLSLIKQTLEVYLREVVANNKKVKWLCICSDDGIGKGEDVLYKTNNIGVPCHTDRDYIKGWLKENSNEDIVVFTTYQSGKIISDLSTELNLSFDVGIYDEAHKTVGPKSKLFSHLLFDSNISVENRVFMTATQRFYSGSNEDIMSMDDIDIYGDVFAEMSFKEAIETEPQLLTDYKVVTIEVTKNEIASFIKENHLVSIDERWGTETESRSLASMIALRKAMNKLPIQNAVSFHSSIAKAKRCKEIQPYIDSRYSFEPIDTFTVSGKIPTTRRNQIVKEFANSDKSLITNSKCLTEGVDVPKIDCIVFSDPRKSQVDIVQALGRALRVKEGKEFGYVIIPVIYDEETNEIDNKNFSEIVSIVRGLSSNDRRIIDYFKMATETKKSQDFATNSLFEVLSDYITEEEILNNLEIKIWEKLAKAEWMPFEEAREFIRKYNLKSNPDFRSFIKTDLRPINFPSRPDSSYKNSGWVSWGDFLGTGYVANSKRKYLPYNEAVKITRKLGLSSTESWIEHYENNPKLHINLPKYPRQTYKYEGWNGMAEWLGKKSNSDWLDFNSARKITSNLGLKTIKEWYIYMSNNRLDGIPKSPSKVYASDGWTNWADWLGNGKVPVSERKYLNFKEARDYARSLNLKNWDDWRFKKDIPSYVPKKPARFYKNKGWISWADWLGTNNVSKHKRNFLSFEKARAIVRKYGFKSTSEWQVFSKSNRPKNIPGNPRKTYKDSGWVSMGDWLGTENVSNSKLTFKSLEEVKKLAKELNILNEKDWREYWKKNTRPSDVPYSPAKTYKNMGWKGWADFFDRENIIKWLPFEEARDYVRQLNIKNSLDWANYAKSGNKPKKIPAKPRKVYKDKGWISMPDWLGTDKE
jgi:superfamily II DNA or RNA helicase